MTEAEIIAWWRAHPQATMKDVCERFRLPRTRAAYVRLMAGRIGPADVLTDCAAISEGLSPPPGLWIGQPVPLGGGRAKAAGKQEDVK